MNHDIEIREYVPEDLDQMVEIWNEVVEDTLPIRLYRIKISCYRVKM